MNLANWIPRASKAFRVEFFTFAVGVCLFTIVTKGTYQFIIFISFVLIASKYFSSSSYLQKLSLAILLPVVLSPLYLLSRGLVTHGKLTRYDLSVYLILFLFILGISSRVVVKKNFNFHRKSIKIAAAGLSSLSFLLALNSYLKFKSLGASLAWVMSGDSRGHLVFANDLAATGWLNFSTFLFQPISAPTFLSFFISNYSIDLDHLGPSLSEQLQTYRLVWILFIGLIGVLASASTELTWKIVNKKQDITPFWLLLLTSSTALFTVLIGPATQDGFFTALLSVAVILAFYNWFLETNFQSNSHKFNLVLGLMLCAGSIMSWMFVAVFTIPLFALSFWLYLNKQSQSRIKINLGFVALAVASLLVIQFSDFSQNLIHKSKVALSVSGAINATSPIFFLFLIFTFTVLVIIVSKIEKINFNFLLVFIFLNLISLYIFKFYSNLGFTKWNYYLLKYQWIMASAIFVILISFTLVQLANYFNQHKFEFTNTLKVFLIICIYTSVYLLSEIASPSKNVWLKVLKGWENPRSAVVDQVLTTDFGSKNPTIFFRHGFDGDSKVGNFWFTAFLTQQEPLRGWNYTIDTNGDVVQMCDVNSYYESVNLITYDFELESALKLACPNETFSVVVEKSSN